MLETYFLNNRVPDLMKILEANDETQHYSIDVNFVSLFEADSEAVTKILGNPRVYLQLCDKSAVTAQEKLFRPGLKIKHKIHTRITSVPVKVNESRIGELISISGIAVRTSQPTVLKVCQRYTCRKCKHVTVVELEWERRIFRETRECEACHSRNIFTESELQHDDYSDYQSIKIQEKFQLDNSISYNTGSQVVLLDDLVDKCRPGDQVDICGVVIRHWGPLVVGRRAEATTFIMANSVTVRGKINESQFSTNEAKEMFAKFWEAHKSRPLIGRDIILGSICPQIYGMYTAKTALAVVLAGGVPKSQDSGTRVRGEPHLLFIGDPGTGKSLFLRTASKLALRSVLTTGIGSTAAGLTASAMKEEGGWHLEGGALVLADGGVCCIDEFSSMRSHDRGAIHEAMEQQTVSVAKAGLVSTLNSRCTVIAATNPTGGQCVDGKEVMTSLGDPLLSRFDLILVLRDNKNLEWDRMISSHILKAAQEGIKKEETIISPKKQQNSLVSESIWSEETLRDYFALIHTMKPVLTPEASEVLRATYRYHRLNPDRRAERTTVRLLESLIRMAEGHARLMYHTQVEIMDALVATQLVGTEAWKDTHSSATGCPFPKDATAVYYKEGEKLLAKLNLGHLSDLL